MHSLVFANLNGIEAVLCGTEGRNVIAYREDGTDLWTFPTDEPTNKKRGWVTGIEVIDLDGDGNDEIVVAADKIYVLYLSNEGKIVRKEKHEIPDSASSMCVFQNGKDKVIVVGDYGHIVTLYDFDFNIIGKRLETGGNIVDISIGDFDDDQNIEIAAVSEDKNVYIIDLEGNKKDIMQVAHWITNIDSIEISRGKARLYVGEFKGEMRVFKPNSQTGQSISLKHAEILGGILDIKARCLFKNSDPTKPQFIVGASDRQLTIFDYDGEIIWSFTSGLGQRAIDIKITGDGQFDLLVGTETGEVFLYEVKLSIGLVKKIVDTVNKICQMGYPDIMDINISQDELNMILNFVAHNPIKQTAKLSVANQLMEAFDAEGAIIAFIEIWWNNCEFRQCWDTYGRVYDIKFSDNHSILAGSDLGKGSDFASGQLFCYQDGDEAEKWSFPVLAGKGTRGVSIDEQNKSVYIVSTDNALYKLKLYGERQPIWNFQHDNWMLFVCVGDFGVLGKRVFVGTEDGKLLAFDVDGVLVWQRKIGERIRAVNFCVHNDMQYVIAGSDDCCSFAR